MRRCVLVALLALSACEVAEPPAPQPQPAEEPQGCPALPTSGNALPLQPLALAARAAPEPSALLAPDAHGREPVIIRFHSRPSAQALAEGRESRVRQLGGQVRHHWPRLGALAARLSPQQREALARDPDVATIVADRPVRALELPRLPLSALLAAPVPSGSTGEYTPGLHMVQAPQVWDANEDGVLDSGAPTGEGIKVCVIDSGIDDRHPELKAAWPGKGYGKDFIDGDDEPLDRDAQGRWGGGHGTHVAGTIAAQLGSGGQVDPSDATQDPAGMVGVAPGVTLLIARVLDTEGNGQTSSVVAAMEWCRAQGAQIASLSLGSPQPDETERQAFEAAWSAGMLSFAASGNGGTETVENQPPIYPAAYQGVIAVGAVDFSEQHPNFSQTGDHLGLVAPGVGVLSASIVGSSPYSEVEVGGSIINSQGLEFARLGDYSGKLVDCGMALSKDSCGAEASCDGFVAYVERGTITFANKVRNVLFQGARAVIIVNNDEEDGEGSFTLGAPGNWPPVASVSKASGAQLKGTSLGSSARVALKGSDYARASGTSMATPHVSGVAALVWSARPTLTNTEVRELLWRSAKDLGTSGHDIVFGHGLVRARAALDLLQATPPAGSSGKPGPSLPPLP